MPPLLNSFDVFDTLIARRSGDSVRVLHRLEERASLPGLAAARLAADRQLGMRGQPYQLDDIWQEVGRTLGLDATTTARLLALEVQMEHDEVIPIAENLVLVKDGDLLVSDTYLSADIVASLLSQAGLDKQVALMVSNDGKFRGWIWPQLLGKVAIGQHFGDNPHSDGRTPTAAGLRAIIYTGAARTPVERFLTEQGCTPLADLIRTVRLANPFPPARAAERHLWLLSCQLNFPLLLFASLWLERHVHDSGLSEVLFVSRDCWLWQELYRRLFPQRRATYLYASRQCLLRPSDNYLDYFRAVWQPGSVIVDLFSTGASWSRLFARLQSRGKCCFIGHVDNYAYLPQKPSPEDWLDIATVFRNSELGTPLNKNVELLNYAAHARVEDVVYLPGGASLPVLAGTLEYDAALPTAVHQSFHACVQELARYPDWSNCRPEALREWIKRYIRWINADRRLDAIYPDHQAADAAYLRQLLS